MLHAIPRCFTLAVLLGSLSTPIGAGFLTTKADWDEISQAHRSGYVMGAWDEMMMMPTEAVGLSAYITDLNTCVLELRLNALHLVEIIDLQYQDVANWQFPPNVVLSMGLREACLSKINASRAQRGQVPFD